MRKSVIISSFNRLSYFRFTWETLKTQLTREDEIIIVADGDEEDWIPYLNTLDFPFQYVQMFEGNYKGGCLAKNIGLRLAQNKMIVVNDPEVMHMYPCIEVFESELRLDPKQFLVPGTLYSGRWEGDIPSNENVTYHSQAPFSAGVLKKELLKVGGWDERFVLWGNDDNDLMYRLGLNGVKHSVLDELRIFHQYHNRPPQKAIGDANESLLYEKKKSIVANKGKDWGHLEDYYEYQTNYL